MKERPILFSGPMVRALLDGRKTQTRRVFNVSGQPITSPDEAVLHFEDGTFHYASTTALSGPYLCRYGTVADRLWVRETWSKAKSCNASDLFYRADGDRQYGRQHTLSYVEREDRWRPSIHMPRWASRITLEVTGVRVERLQDISIEDARAEGFPADHEEMADKHEAYPIAWYCNLWEEINGAESWAANPWVWCISFKRVPE